MHRRALLAVLLTGQTMASMDGSIVTVALAAIRRDLDASGAELQLVVSAYLLTFGVLIVTGARLGDLLGHRRAFLAGLAVFTTASLACGLAPTAAPLIAARIVQATGAALMIPQVLSLIQLRFSGPARHRAIGLYSMVLALGVALGQVVGGLVVAVDLFGLSWRPAFLLNVPVGVALLVAGPRVLEPTPPLPRRLDLAGVAVLTLAMAALTVPPVFGREYGWRPWAWATLAAGIVLVAAFVRVERRVARRGGLPLLDLSVLRPRGIRSGLAVCLIVMGCYAGFIFTFTLYLQDRLGYGPLAAGLAFVPYAAGFATLSLTWPRLPARVHHLLPVAGPPAFAAATAAIAVGFAGGWPVYPLAPLLFLGGAGHAAAYSPLVARMSTVIAPARASALSALVSTGPILASVMAIAVLGGVYLAAGTGWTLGAVCVLLAAAGLGAVASARGLALAARETPADPRPVIGREPAPTDA